MKPLPSPEYVRSVLRYDPETGLLFWLPRAREHFKSNASFASWNAKHADKEAFTWVSVGYRRGRLCGADHLAHRVAWVIMTGEWPDEVIDHINKTPLDNRWPNLRKATQAQNQANRSPQKQSASKYLGVDFNFRSGKWRARLGKDGKSYALGYHMSEESAARAYDRAAQKIHGEFASLNFPQVTA